MFDTLFSWAFKIGKELTKIDEELVRRLIFEIRGEETPGRFLGKLSNKISEYKMSKNIRAEVDLHPLLFQQTWYADKFHYMKAAVISGLNNAIGSFEGESSG